MSWKSEEMLSEEIALHILMYLKALVDPAESENPEINERVEQFVFSSSNPSKAEFGEFAAELSSSYEGFVFRFYVK
ncbi:hypothetical protein C772_02273 [Bhargavaea cecembensis DSE10]|uniref:Uncharacterized protein n=1 Tax=Bhargavaea cecembensis DSE10 TaxID=1235279 RepID=M7NVX3_9BACL|nr:hypothetical protein [Bhargavaea cecembensis]EMR05785.1 hypothetical protein C772_02273 [Bhargavaea cecembensis DSE10]